MTAKRRKKHGKLPNIQFPYSRRKISPCESPKFLTLRPKGVSWLLVKEDMLFDTEILSSVPGHE